MGQTFSVCAISALILAANYAVRAQSAVPTADGVLTVSGVRTSAKNPVTGLGCVIDPRGYVLASAHQTQSVEGLAYSRVNGTSGPLVVLDDDLGGDLALLKMDVDAPAPLRFGHDRELDAGDVVYTFASDPDRTRIEGRVISTNRLYRSQRVIQCRLEVGPGSSGGPVLNREGELVGVVIGRMRTAVDQAIVAPISSVFPVLQEHGIPVPNRPPQFKGQGPALALDSLDAPIRPADHLKAPERHAVEAYNAAVEAAQLDTKSHLFKTAARLLPDFYDAWLNLGVTHMLQGEYEAAATALERATELQSHDETAKRYLALAYLEDREWGSAIAAFQALADANPDQPGPQNDLGEACRRAGKLGRAESIFESVLADAPGYAPAQYNLALVYAQSNRPGEAIAIFEKYLADRSERSDRSDRDQVLQWIALLKAHRNAAP